MEISSHSSLQVQQEFLHLKLMQLLSELKDSMTNTEYSDYSVHQKRPQPIS